MGANTKIEWCDFTFNCWRGCTKVSEACRFCYAETMSKRNQKTLGVWGPNGTRVVASESMWREPLRWNSDSGCAARLLARSRCSVSYRHQPHDWCDGNPDGEPWQRPRVFCASLADVFEDWTGPIKDSRGLVGHVYHADGSWGFGPATDAFNTACSNARALTMDDVRRRLFELIDATPNLDWMLLTKRPENVLRFAYEAWCKKVSGHISQNEGDGRQWAFPTNVWIGTSVENQAAADERLPHLRRIPANVRFLSCEPLLGNIRLNLDGIRLVIVGGESGAGARPCRPEWIRSIVQQCRSAGVACFVKQMGANIVTRNDMIEDAFSDGASGWPEPEVEHNINGFREDHQGADCRIRLRDKKGGDMDEWPQDLRVREMP